MLHLRGPLSRRYRELQRYVIIKYANKSAECPWPTNINSIRLHVHFKINNYKNKCFYDVKFLLFYKCNSLLQCISVTLFKYLLVSNKFVTESAHIFITFLVSSRSRIIFASLECKTWFCRLSVATFLWVSSST